jgi:competence protein ComEA
MLKKFVALLAMLVVTTLAMARVDVNKATEAELDSVKGIGPGTSKAILDERKKAPFKSWDDFISRVKGVGESRATNLSEAGLRVNGRTYQPTAAKKDDAKADKKEAAAEKKEAKAEKKEAKAEAAKPAPAASAKK